MKKLRLNVESLSVQTFEADADLPRTRRTVVGHHAANLDGDFAPQSGIVNVCHTWDRYDAYCALSRGMEEDWGCTGVCEP